MNYDVQDTRLRDILHLMNPSKKVMVIFRDDSSISGTSEYMLNELSGQKLSLAVREVYAKSDYLIIGVY